MTLSFPLICWIVAGEFFMPKGITLYWYKPCGVANAEISFARSLKGICQNAFNKSNFETYSVLCITNFIDTVVHPWNGKCVRFCEVIDLSVIGAHAIAAIRFGNENTW